MYFYYFVIISPWKRVLSYILINLNPQRPRMFVPSLVEMAQWFLRKRWKCEKFTDRWMDRRTDGQTTGDQISSLELKAQLSLKPLHDTFKQVKMTLLQQEIISRNIWLQITSNILYYRLSTVSKLYCNVSR